MCSDKVFGPPFAKSKLKFIKHRLLGLTMKAVQKKESYQDCAKAGTVFKRKNWFNLFQSTLTLYLIDQQAFELVDDALKTLIYALNPREAL